MEMLHPQTSAADARRSATQGLLIITKAPATAQSLIGKALLNAGALTVAGDYACAIRTHDWSLVDVVLKPSSVTGTFAPSLDRMYFGGLAVRNSQAGSNFANGVAQTISLTDLKGTQDARVSFTIPGGGAITFAEGADKTNPAALAEFNGQ